MDGKLKDDQSISVQIANTDTQSIESNGKETEPCDFKCEKPLNVFCGGLVKVCLKESLGKLEHILHEKTEESVCEDS